MAIPQTRIEYLLKQYVINNCTRSELLELFEWIELEYDDTAIQNALQFVWQCRNADLGSIKTSIQKNFYNKPSGNYLLLTNSVQSEKKGNYRRGFSNLWSLCVLYQAANKIEKVDAGVQLLDPLIVTMNKYYDPALPKPAYSDYIMKLNVGMRYYDDNQWIGITSLDAFERTKKKARLALGKTIYDFMMNGYDTVLDGDLYWKETSKSSKNTCSNGPGVLVALQLCKIVNEKKYLDMAMLIFNWTNEKQLARSGLYNDNICTGDGNSSKPELSYNTGMMLESNVYLYGFTKDEKYLKQANAIADSSFSFYYGKVQFRDGYLFNAVLPRAYQDILQYNKDTNYITGFKKCLDYTLQHEKNEQVLFFGKHGVYNLLEQSGMLKIPARYVWLDSHYDFAVNTTSIHQSINQNIVTAGSLKDHESAKKKLIVYLYFPKQNN